MTELEVIQYNIDEIAMGYTTSEIFTAELDAIKQDISEHTASLSETEEDIGLLNSTAL